VRQEHVGQMTQPRKVGRSRFSLSLVTGLLIVALSLVGGWASAQIASASAQIASASASPSFTLARVDVLPERLNLGEQVYLRECSSCHIAPSPAIMPTQTWATLLVRADHYGVEITPLRPPVLDLVWDYVQFSSRPIRSTEPTPTRIRDSQYFRALHPRVESSQPFNLSSCLGCHPGVEQYNFRDLTPEWDNAP